MKNKNIHWYEGQTSKIKPVTFCGRKVKHVNNVHALTESENKALSSDIKKLSPISYNHLFRLEDNDSDEYSETDSEFNSE